MYPERSLKKEERFLLEILLNDPSSLQYCKHKINHQFFLKTMNKFLGRELGIEIENRGSALKIYCESFNIKEEYWFENTAKKIKEEYNLLNFCNENENDGLEDFCEQQARLKGWKSAEGYYRWLLWCANNLKINEVGAIHIHVDFRKEFALYLNTSRLNHQYQIDNWKRQKELKFLIEKVFKYTGTYNRHTINLWKTGCIAVRDNFETIEFRMGKCTFIYKDIIKWAICSTLWVESVSRKLPLNLKVCEEIMSI